MKLNNPFFLVAIGAALYIAAQKGITGLSNQLSWGLPRIRVGNVNYNGLRAEIFLPITSRFPADVQLQGFSGVLKYGNYQLGMVNIPQAVVIESGETSTLATNVDISFANLSQNLVALLSSGQLLQSLRIVGTLRVMNVNFPIDQPITVL